VKPTLAQTLRGLRLGYHWHHQINAYMRIIDLGSDRFAISVRPVGTIKGTDRTKHNFRMWWQGDDPVPLVPCLVNVICVKRPLDFEVDDEGNLLQ
jgi:hypothetical protein